MRDSFIFYGSFLEAIKDLPDEERLKCYDAICIYALEGELPDVSGVSKAVFSLAKPNIDSSIKNRENGRKGGKNKSVKPTSEESLSPLKKSGEARFGKSVKGGSAISPSNEDEDGDEDRDIDEDEEKDVDKDNTQKGGTRKRETQEQIFDRLVQGRFLDCVLEDKIREWLKYKSERKEPYKETGMRSLINKIEKAVDEFGVDAVMDSIDSSMSSGWKGLFFDKLKSTGKPTTYVEAINNRYDVLTEWYEANKEYEERKRYDTG